MSVKRIERIGKFSCDIVCPPDKSITHRAVMYNAVAKGEAHITRPLLGEDCLSTIDCMRKLGAQIEIKEDGVHVRGVPKLSDADLYAGNSGTTMRLMCGLLSPYRGTWRLTGDESLSRRPMRRVIDPLTRMGAEIVSCDGKAPLTVTGKALHGIDYVMPVDSAQVKSAVISAALGAEGVTRITEREFTRDHTEIILAAMGADISREGKTVTVRGGRTLEAVSVTVAGDISGAAFPLVCGLITDGEVTVRHVGLNPTRAGLLEVFEQIGVHYTVEERRQCCGEEVGTVTVKGLGQAKPYTITHEMIPRLVDEIPVLAVLACFLDGDSVITGAEELRVKESDRIAATLRMLRAFGGEVRETESGMIIHGKGQLSGGCAFDPAGDHRMAMSAAVAAAASEKGGTVTDSDCVAVSYPDFWQMLSGGTK